MQTELDETDRRHLSLMVYCLGQAAEFFDRIAECFLPDGVNQRTCTKEQWVEAITTAVKISRKPVLEEFDTFEHEARHLYHLLSEVFDDLRKQEGSL